MADNVDKMSVKNLKAYLTRVGIDPASVGPEKKNLQNRVRSHMEEIAAGPAGGQGPPAAVAPAGNAAGEGGAAATPARATPATAGAGGAGGSAPAGVPGVDPAIVSAARAPVDILYLGEMHESLECSIENSKIITRFTGSDPKKLLFATEGRGVNACFQFLLTGLPPGRGQPVLVSEYETMAYDDRESLLTFFLDAEPALEIARGAPVTMPDGTPLTAAFFLNHFLTRHGEGHGAFLAKVGVEKLAKEFMILATAKRADDALDRLTRVTTAIRDYVTTNAELANLVPLVQALLDTGFSRESFQNIARILNAERDVAYVNKVLRAVIANPQVTKVVIIRGDLHTLITLGLLDSVPWVTINRASKSYTGRTFGGGRRRTRQRRTHKRKGKGRKSRRRN